MSGTSAATERESWFNSGLLFLLIFLSFLWKGPNLKVRLLHAAILLAGFFMARAIFARFNRPSARDEAAGEGDVHGEDL